MLINARVFISCKKMKIKTNLNTESNTFSIAWISLRVQQKNKVVKVVSTCKRQEQDS